MKNFKTPTDCAYKNCFVFCTARCYRVSSTDCEAILSAVKNKQWREPYTHVTGYKPHIDTGCSAKSQTLIVSNDRYDIPMKIHHTGQRKGLEIIMKTYYPKYNADP